MVTLLTTSRSIESAMKSGTTADCLPRLRSFSGCRIGFWEHPACGIRVLGARPLRVRENWSTELFGDYTPETMLVRVWMKTAVRKEVTSFGTFLSTLCHEFCHHLDFQKFGFADSWHTRGFYERAAVLYHYARGTPLKKLFWVQTSGERWRISTGRARIAQERPIPPPFDPLPLRTSTVTRRSLPQWMSSSAGILPAVPKASRPRHSGRRRPPDGHRNGGVTITVHRSLIGHQAVRTTRSRY